VDLSFLPGVNASLNAAAALLLVSGLLLVRRKRVQAHHRVMLGAFAVSTLFLVLYVLHKAWRDFENTPFHGEGLVRVAYLVILSTHVALAMTVPVFAVILIRLASKGRFDSHRRLARVVWPIWIYVSVTGIVIYAALYHWNPAPPGGGFPPGP
jgi:uncharacterized membrane protein YozB (DUF420 family)